MTDISMEVLENKSQESDEAALGDVDYERKGS